MLARSWWPGTWLVVLAACSSTEYVDAPTQVLLQLDCADEALLERTKRVRIAVSTLEGELWRDAEPVTLEANGLRWPVEIPIYPRKGSDASRVFQVVAQALAESDVLAETRAVSRFSPGAHEQLRRELFFCVDAREPRLCTTEPCAGEECLVCQKSGACEPVGFTDELVDSTPPDAGDAGQASREDARIPVSQDAGDAVRPPDAGAEDDASRPIEDDGAVMAPASCDEDKDGFFDGRSECDAMRGAAELDCDDGNNGVHPGAAVVCGDGVRNDCATWDPDAELFLQLSEASFVPEKPLEITPSEYLVSWSFASARVGGAPASTAVAFRYEPLTSGGGPGEVQLRMFNAANATPASATVTQPADLLRWTHGPQLVWSGSAFAFHALAAQGSAGSAPLNWTWNGVSTATSAPWGTFPDGCSRAGSTSGPVSVDKQSWAALAGDYWSGNGLLVYFGATYARCIPVSGALESIDLASDHVVVGGAADSVQVWDLSQNAPATYSLAHPRLKLPGLANFARPGLSVTAPYGSTLALAYASQGGVTVETIDVGNGALKRVHSLDLAHTGFGLRNVLLSPLANGLLLTLFGVGDPDARGKLPGVIRAIVLRTNSELSVVSDRTLSLGDGPYEAPVLQVVGPSVTELWHDAIFLRQVGRELREGRLRYCTKL